MSEASLRHQLLLIKGMGFCDYNTLAKELKCSKYTIKTYFENNNKLDGVTRLTLEKCIASMVSKAPEKITPINILKKTYRAKQSVQFPLYKRK
jgi:hypothetical protein